MILGSATPSFETYVNAQRSKITRLDLRSRHHGGALPAVEVVDLTQFDSNETKRTLFTPTLIEAVRQTLARKTVAWRGHLCRQRTSVCRFAQPDKTAQDSSNSVHRCPFDLESPKSWQQTIMTDRKGCSPGKAPAFRITLRSGAGCPSWRTPLYRCAGGVS